MSLSLLMLAVFLLATDNLLKFIGHAQRDTQVYVYLEDRLDDDEIQRLQHRLLAMKEVDAIIFISKEEALAEFRTQLDENENMLDALETNPLPNSFRVKLKPEYNNKASITYFAGQVSQLGGVEETRYGKEFIEKFTRIITGVYYVDIVVGFIVILSAIFIISNAVRLTVISRKNNIQILRLVGATNRFITTPFIVEGAFQGGIAAIFSLLLLFVITVLSRRVVPELSFFSFEKSAIYMGTCIAIGAIGSFTALRRYLKV
jgi:cell division transport system permease protein